MKVSISVITALALTTAAGLPTAEAADASAPPNRPTIGVVLAGGGAKGIAHIGVLQVLDELNVPVDYIVGTSMGSIIAGSYATGLSAAELQRRVESSDLADLLRDKLPRQDRSFRSKTLERANIYGVEVGIGKEGFKLPTGALYGQYIEVFLGELAGASADVGSFDNLPVPFRAVATDIVSGQMVVLDRGDLVSAMRASMAVPGVFSPEEIGGHLLVDGGLVRNLPVDVARSMGADIIIAVHLVTTPVKKENIRNALDVTSQMVDLLIDQNVNKSLSELTQRDLLISPQLGTFSSTDFRDSPKLIPLGRAAALKVQDRLRALALPPEQYKALRAAQLARMQRTVPVTQVRVDTSQLGPVNPKSVDALVQPGPTKGVSRATVQDKVDSLLATDDFQQVRYRFVDADGERALVLEPIAKGWGPNYLRFGLNLSTDFSGDSNFTIALDHRMTWLNELGLEWRNDVALGQVTGINSELYQPLDYARRFFVAPRVNWWQQSVDLFVNEDAFAELRERQAGAGLDFGVNLGRAGELRMGYEWSKVWAWQTVGLPLVPDYEEEYGALRARLTLDKLDNWAFPASGYFFSAEAKAARPGLGGTLDFDRVDLRLEKPFVLGARHSVTTALEWGDSLGTTLPFTQTFPLGGFLRLSGYQPMQFLSDRYAFGRLVYYYRLGNPGVFAERLFLGGSLEAAYITDRRNGSLSDPFLPAGSIFVAADTLAGPLYLGVGAAQDSNYGIYLFLGRP